MEAEKNLLDDFQNKRKVSDYDIETNKIRLISIIIIIYYNVLYAFTGRNVFFVNLYGMLLATILGFVIAGLLGAVIAIFLNKQQPYTKRLRKVIWLIMLSLGIMVSMVFTIGNAVVSKAIEQAIG